MSGDIENLILTTIERWWAGRYSERHGLVTSYDPEKYLAKVKFMPEGQESGWLPVETGHIGQGYGITVGLQVGSGDSGTGGSGSQASSQSGDQVIVRFQEGDFESGKIVQRVHSDQETPPKTESGEIIIWAQFKKDASGDDQADGGQAGTGQQIYLKNDGSLTWTDGNGATVVFDGKGNATLTCNNLTENINGNRVTAIKGSDKLSVGGTKTTVVTGDVGIKGGGNVEIQAGSNLGLDAGSEVIVQGGGSVSNGSVTAPKAQPPVPPFQVP
jgi:hypothetical protein